MRYFRSYPSWGILNEVVKQALAFGEGGEYVSYFYVRGTLLSLSWNMVGIDLDKLKATFTELGYSLNDELERCAEDAQLPSYDRYDLYDRFLKSFLPDQPGVIGFNVGYAGELELMPNKHFHYENSPVLVKLLTYLGKRGFVKVRPPRRQVLSLTIYLEELQAHNGKLVLPEFYYHGTSSVHFASILKHGITAGQTKSNYNVTHADRVFLTTQPEVAYDYALNAAENVFHSLKNDEEYAHDEPVVFKIDSRLLDPAKMVMDYDLYVNFRRNNTEPRYDKFLDKCREMGRTLADMKTKVKDQLDPAVFYKIGYQGRVMPQAFAAVLLQRKEYSVVAARQKLRDMK